MRARWFGGRICTGVLGRASESKRDELGRLRKENAEPADGARCAQELGGPLVRLIGSRGVVR